MNIIFIAPPAAGKGTVSALLEERKGYIHLSTGDLLRAEIKKGTEFGNEINDIFSKGELVSDEIITKLLKNKLATIKNQKFILDGYPRNLNQAETLNEIFNELAITDYMAIYLSIDEETAMKRALGRLVCSDCGATYNKYFQETKPKKDGICDKCQGPLNQRADDNEETFKVRFNTYLNVTNPLIDYYKEKGKLEIVDTTNGSENSYQLIEQILESENVNN